MRVLINAALVVASLLASLILVEIALRIYSPFGFTMKGTRIVLPANIGYKEVLPDGTERIRFRHNSLGFRGAEPPRDIASRLSIVAVGGSTTHSIAQDDDHAWPAVTERLLRRHFQDVWMNNAGIDGHSTIGHAILFDDILAPLKPNVVLLLVGVNEVFADSELQDVANVVDREAAGAAAGGGSGYGWFKRHFRSTVVKAANVSEVASLGLNLYRHFVHTDREFYGIDPAQWRKAMAREGGFTLDPDVGKRLIEAHAAVQIPAYEGRLTRLVRRIRAGGALPILMTQPLVVGPAIDPVTGTDLARIRVPFRGEHLDGATAWALMEVYNQATRRVATATDTPLVDLARDMPKRLDFYYDVMHYTDDGSKALAALVATAVCRTLSERGIAALKIPCD